MTPAEQYFEDGILRVIDLQRVATWLIGQYIADLQRLQQDLIGLIGHAWSDTGRTAKLIQRIEKLIREAMEELANRIDDDFDELADIEAKHQRRMLLLLWGEKLAKTKVAFSEVPVLGAPLHAWVTQIGQTMTFSSGAMVRELGNNGATVEEALKAIRGQGTVPTSGGSTAPVDVATRSLEATVRTGVEAVLNEVLPAVVKESKISPHGWQHISVLDSRTTQICQDRAWKIWDAKFEPVGHKIPYAGGPPLHMNCRSRMQLIFLDDPNLPRRSFLNWLTSKPKDEAEAIFGKKKMELWRKGLLTDSQLIRQVDRQMTFDDLKKKDII